MAYFTVIVAVLVLVNTYPLIMTQDMMFQSKQTSMQGQVALLCNALPMTGRLTSEGVEQALNLEELNYSRLLVTDESGLILYDSGEESDLGRYALIEGVVSALRGNDVFFCEYRDGVFRSWAAAPVLTRGRVVGAVYLYGADESQGILLKEVQNNIQIISVVVCVLVMLISILLSRTFTKRIADLLRAIRIVREGRYSHRLEVTGKDELSQLGEEFNQLTGRLQTTEEARRRFVSDASHELKTPLASIKLLTDSILQEEMDPETTREFVEDIGEAADRLIHVSEDLLAINRLDGGQTGRTEPVDLAVVVKKSCHLLEPLALAAGVEILPKLQSSCMVLGHEGALSQIMLNLMENAIKYNLPEGTVQVTLWEEDEMVRVLVEDTGVGIPDEDLPHIFERFYRVDKARARDAGGTGLGLSIVWEAVQVHGGHISIEPAPEGGTRVQVQFPCWKKEIAL